MMLFGLIFIGALFVRTEALKGQNFPIPSEELYEDYTTKVEKKCWTPKNSTGEKWIDCMDKNPLTVDYTCRFSLFGYKCFCCGAFFHYTEHGKICTRFCLLKDGRKFCEPGLIILPFNWGDPIPDKVTLDDGERRRGPDGKVRLKKETEVNVNVTEFKTSDKCPSSPLKFDPKFGPNPNAPLEPGVWENSEWGSNATAKGPGGAHGPNSGEPRPRLPQKPKDWNEIVWSSDKEGSNPQTTTSTTTKRPLKNRHGDSHTFGGGGNIREQNTKDVTESATTTRKATTTTRKPVTDRFGQPVQGWGSEQLRQKPTTTTRKPSEPPTTTTKPTTTRKPMDVKDRFSQLVQATGANWGSQQSKEDPSNIEKRVSTSENRKEANVRRTTRKSRPTKKKRTTTKRPNQFGVVGINDLALVDSSGVKLTTSAPTSTTTTRSTSTDDRPNWGAPPSSSSPTKSSSSPTKRPKVEESTNAISKDGSTATKKQDDKPIWG